MRVAVPHNTTREMARTTVEQKLQAMLAQFGGQAEEMDHYWTDDTLHFKGKARGFALEGTIEVTDADVIIDGKLPLMALPFEHRIRQTVEKETASLFRMA